MKVILVSGKAQNGKDTAAKMIRDNLKKDGHRVLITHYGDLVKFICTNYFDWNGEKDEEGRGLLQYVGTDVIREQNPSFWVDFVSTLLRYFSDNWDYVIIPDARFPNEITKMKTDGFDTIHLRVERSNFISPLTGAQQNHASEIALDEFEADCYLKNDGTLDDLESKIIKWIKETLYENTK